MDCAGATSVIDRMLAGLPVSEAELAETHQHVATCEKCAGRFEVADVSACSDFEVQLLEAARLQAAGEDPTGRWPELDEHLAACSRCRAVLHDLAEEPAMEPSDPTGDLRTRSLFERALTSALAAPEPIVRLRACLRLGELDHMSAVASTALATTAEHDPDDGVRTAAQTALGRAGQIAATKARRPRRSSG
jgi:hypothetical protein